MKPIEPEWTNWLNAVRAYSASIKEGKTVGAQDNALKNEQAALAKLRLVMVLTINSEHMLKQLGVETETVELG